MLRSAPKAFGNELNTADKKKFWKIMKYLRKEQNTIPVLSHNGSTAHNDSEKANIFNTFFSQYFNTKLPPLTPSDSHSLIARDECPENILCTEEEILHLLKNIAVSKSSGRDKISGGMLKATAYNIAPSITKLFKLSIQLGCFSQTWKVSNVVLIPKSTDNMSPTNYRLFFIYIDGVTSVPLSIQYIQMQIYGCFSKKIWHYACISYFAGSPS